jgi:hypothetical protein
LAGNINADFSHRDDRTWIQGDGMGPGAEDLKPITGKMPQQSFSYLAACGVPCAEKEYPLLHKVVLNLSHTVRGTDRFLWIQQNEQVN